MAFVINTTAYVNKEAEGWYSKAILMDGFKSSLTQIPNVIVGQNLARLDVGNVLQPWTCTFSSSGSANLSEKPATVKAIKINLEECKDVLWTSYLANQLRSTSEAYPADFEAYLMDRIADSISSKLDDLVINGATGSGDPFDGFLTQFLADGTVIDVPAPIAITPANVFAEMGRLYDLIPLAVRMKGDVKIYISPAVAASFYRALSATYPAAQGMSVNQVETQKLMYLDVEVVVIKHLPAARMFATNPSNLITLTTLAAEINQINVLDMAQSTGDNKIRITGEFKYGVNYYLGEEIVLY
jgi:hypothetical protein